MACVGVAQAGALGVEEGVETGDKHVLGDTSQQRLVDLSKYLSRRGGAQRLSSKLQHAAGGRHHQCCGHPLARCVPHHDSQPTLREKVEVVEVAPHFPSGSVEWRDLPALKLGHFGIPPLARTRLPYATLASPILPSSKSAGLL